MKPIDPRLLILGSAAAVVLTQIACTAWIAKEITAYRPTDNASEFADIAKQLASVESAVGDVQDSSDNIQARTEALVASMSSVSRACAFR
jgi:hypothetical protein